MPRKKTVRDLQWFRDRTKDDGDCWLWTAGVCDRGFPRFTDRVKFTTRSKQARRVLWELHSGEKAGARQVTTTCKNRLCMNPEHLAAISKSDVVREVWRQPAARARKVLAGMENTRARPTTKLDMIKARYIRNSDKSCTALAKELGVSVALVSKVRTNKCWRESHASPFAGLMR